MSFFKKIFNKKDEPIKSYQDFWNWFLKNEKTFFKTVTDQSKIHGLAPTLASLRRPGFAGHR